MFIPFQLRVVREIVSFVKSKNTVIVYYFPS